MLEIEHALLWNTVGSGIDKSLSIPYRPCLWPFKYTGFFEL
ncbi:hypothetical protein LX66_1837 [Chitinophaga japonensis]|uniref:Uncharacterized protein n=1 Tax=Chitinophaga japonensis TaxID=104662 RepID=A0A562T3X4_CHIJA|nr:hypothetical protein LX66_1837 [Chitinophaga japonensis]